MRGSQLVAASLGTGVDNAQALLLKIAGVAVIFVGAGLIWAAKKGNVADVIGTLAIVIVGLTVIVLGLGFATAGQSIGKTVLTFFGF
jgi:hypothetical protein